MGECISVEGLLEDPLEAPTQPVMRAEPVVSVVHPQKVSYNCPFLTCNWSLAIVCLSSLQGAMSSMPYKVPSHPLPGELALLDNITILHFRKSAISAAADSITKVLPETSSTMAGSQSPLQGMLSKDSVELVGSPQDFLLGSKSSLLGAGVQTPTAVQIMSSSSDASNRVTIPAQHLSRAAAPALLSFNKYSKVGACNALGRCKVQTTST